MTGSAISRRRTCPAALRDTRAHRGVSTRGATLERDIACAGTNRVAGYGASALLDTLADVMLYGFEGERRALPAAV